MRKHSNPELNALVRELAERGWVHVESKKHFKMRSPGGRLLSMSLTPSCPFVYKKVRHEAEAIEREECDQRS